MRRMLALAITIATVLTLAQARAASPVAQNRSTEPVVLNGSQFPSWSAGPDPTLREPQAPVNYETADIQPNLGPLQSDCYNKTAHPNPYDYSDNGDHNCYQASRVPSNPLGGADVKRILGYAWTDSGFQQIPFQVDEVFSRFITNNYSGFAFYSGVDKETTYAWDREAFRYTSDNWLNQTGDLDPCHSAPASGTIVDGKATTLDPVEGLDDNDELVFMYSDAGDLAPPASPKPSGIESMYQVAVADPSNPSVVKHVYVALSDGSVTPAFNAANGYVHYDRDANADTFAYSQSSYDGYGAAPKGPYCNDGSATPSTTYHNFKGSPPVPDKPAHGITVDSADPAIKAWAIEQRRPRDGATISTNRYKFRYEGRWLMTELHVSPSDTGLATQDYGPDLIDQWKARAFQQRPGGTTPCCGYEEEVNNWGGSSILFGERAGPVRAIRAAWGADSSTNNVKTETFYRDEIRFGDNLRVHVIPPADGIYVQWDYNAGAVDTYYNPFVPNGVPIDGINDEVFGNTDVHIASDRIEFRDDDNMPVVGAQHVTVPLQGGPDDCKFGSEDGVCNDLDFADPTFSGPAGNLNWEQIAGPNGTLVTRWTIKEHTGGDGYSLIAQPYYRDDSCFDDGTGSNPGPHLRGRSIDVGPARPNNGETFAGDASQYWNGSAYVTRRCWTPADGDPALATNGPRTFVQGDIATHGLHLQLIADSDNAQLAEPVDEIVSEQRMVVLPGGLGNVGEQYGRHVEFPLTAVSTLYVG